MIKSSYEEILSLQGLTENLLELTQQQKKRGSLKLEEVSLLEITEAALKKVVPIEENPGSFGPGVQLIVACIWRRP